MELDKALGRSLLVQGTKLGARIGLCSPLIAGLPLRTWSSPQCSTHVARPPGGDSELQSSRRLITAHYNR